MGSMLRETLVRLAEVEGGGHNNNNNNNNNNNTNTMKDRATAAPKKQKWVPVLNHRFKRAYFVVSMHDSFGYQSV